MLPERVYEWFALWELAQERGTPFSLDAHNPTADEREAFLQLVRAMTPATVSLRDNGADTTESGPARLAGRSVPTIPGYDVIRELGRGGMGAVYLAHDLKLNRPVAIKVVLGGLFAGPTSMVRFLAEAEALAAIQHPNIVQVFERGEHDGLLYYVMEHCPKGSLSDRVEEHPLAARAAAEMVEQLARAVAAAHARGILHRDLKPANVLFASDGAPKIADFGLAKRVDGSGEAKTGITLTGDVIGTPSYMAPEQAKGDTKAIGPGVDVYALGAILYRVLTGRPPFLGANNHETIRQVVGDEPVAPTQLVPALPRDLSTICLKCLAKEPAKRYRIAEELADDLRRFLGGKPIVARPVGSAERAVKWVMRNPVVTASTAAVVTALVAGTTVSYVKYRDAEVARSAEAERVKERDNVIDERDEAIGKRDIAIKDGKKRADELEYQLGVTNMVLASNAHDNRDASFALELLDKVPPKQRKFEWHFLKRQALGGIFMLHGHTDRVMSVAYSPDGARIVTGSLDQTVKVWDARTGTALVELKGHTDGVTSVAFSPDGMRIVTNEGTTAKVWDARTGTALVELKGHWDQVTSVAYSPDGARIVTGSYDGTAMVWDARTGTALVELEGQTDRVNSVAFSPNGTRIVTGGEGNTAKMWDARTWTALVELKGHTQMVQSVAFSPDGTRIVTGSYDRTAKVWDARTGTALVELKGHTGMVWSVAFRPDGARIVTGSYDGTAIVWDARTGAALVELKGHRGMVWGASYSPDGARIVTGSYDGTAKVWDAQTGRALVELKGHRGWVWSVSYSPDGARIVTGSADRSAKVWDARTGRALVELKAHTREVVSVAFSPDGARIVTGSADRSAKVWDARMGTALVELKGHTDRVSSVAFSPDGARIVTGSNDGTAKVWDARGGNPLSTEGVLDTDELAYRLEFTAPNILRYQENLQAAKNAKDEFATRFYQERLWAMPPYTVARFRDRNEIDPDPRLTARAGFHQPELAKTPYDRSIVQAMAVSGDRLSQRLVAQQLIRDGQPAKAIPLLVGCLVFRPITLPPKPPVEELLIAKAYLAMNNLPEAKRYYKAATDWLDRPRNPMRAANIVTHAVNPWNALGECFKPVDDPRHNPFDWESWHECDVFRAQVEADLSIGR